MAYAGGWWARSSPGWSARGSILAALELRTLDRATAEQHYAEHTEKPFFGELVDFITGGPLVALVAEGPRAVEAARGLIGATDPVKSAPGSIRGDFALEIGENLVHGSDSPESAAREVAIFFPGTIRAKCPWRVAPCRARRPI